MKKSGFTLVEILIVVAIIGLLFAIAVPSFIKAKKAALDRDTSTPVKPEETQYIVHNKGGYRSRVSKMTFDGCEYIVVGGGGQQAWGTHKGNCYNPIHKYNIEKEDNEN